MEISPFLLALCTGLRLFLGGMWLARAVQCRYRGLGATPEAPLAPWGGPEKLRCAAEAGTGLLLVLSFAPGVAAVLGLALAVPWLLDSVKCMRQRNPRWLDHAAPVREAADGWSVAWAGLFLAAHAILVAAHTGWSGGAAWFGRPKSPGWEETALALALVVGATLCLRALEFLVRARGIARGRVVGQYIGT